MVMKLLNGWVLGSLVRHLRPYRIYPVLFLPGQNIYVSNGGGAPLWVQHRFGAWRIVPIHWERIQDGHAVWWAAQRGNILAVVGNGLRPALVISQESAASRKRWSGIVPPGYGALDIILPNAGPCRYDTVGSSWTPPALHG